MLEVCLQERTLLSPLRTKKGGEELKKNRTIQNPAKLSWIIQTQTFLCLLVVALKCIFFFFFEKRCISFHTKMSDNLEKLHEDSCRVCHADF